MSHDTACLKCGSALGEAARTSATVCAFCGTLSTPAPTPSAPSMGGASIYSCPCCRGPLFEGRAGEIVLFGCPGCGGVWVENASAQKVVRDAPQDVLVMAERASATAQRSDPASRTHASSCPMCGGPLKRVMAPRGQIELDVCPAHGTWFDRAELAAVIRALRGGASARAQPAASGGSSVAAEVAGDVAAGAAVEVTFGLLGALLSAALD